MILTACLMIASAALWGAPTPMLTGISSPFNQGVTSLTFSGTGFQNGATVTLYINGGTTFGGSTLVFSGAQVQNLTSTSFQIPVPALVFPKLGMPHVPDNYEVKITNPDGGTAIMDFATAGGITPVAFTSTAGEIDTLNTTTVSKRVDTYSVELKARLQGGSILFDQTFQVALSDPLAQAGIAQAKTVLTNAGAKSFLTLNQLSSVESLVSAITNTVPVGTPQTQTIIGTKATLGPAFYFVGNLGVCQSYVLEANNHLTFDPAADFHAILSGCAGGQPAGPAGPSANRTFFVALGQESVDVSTVTLVTGSQTSTTTSTFLTTQVYELDGVTGQAAPPATPAPPSWLLTMIGMVGVGLYFGRRKFTAAN